MVMVSDAFKNYLVEVTVMGIAKECEESGMLSAAIHARHKVRKTDLERFFSCASKVDKGSWERKFYSYCLIVYASAAYEDVGNIISSGKSVFGQSLVKPHWSKEGKSYALESIVYYEPLNLFPGLSTDNLSYNNTMIDQHVAAHYPNGTSKSLAMMSHQSRDKPTTNQTTAKHILLESQGLSGASSSLQTPVKQTTFKAQGTPISSALSKDGRVAGNIATSSNMQEATDKFDETIKKKEKNAAAHAIYTQVESLYRDAQALTLAGEQHYNNLLANYEKALASIKQAPDPLDIEVTLVTAREKWKLYRGSLERLLAKFKEETKEDFPLM